VFTAFANAKEANQNGTNITWKEATQYVASAQHEAQTRRGNVKGVLPKSNNITPIALEWVELLGGSVSGKQSRQPSILHTQETKE
jgi:hypothetical protein